MIVYGKSWLNRLIDTIIVAVLITIAFVSVVPILNTVAVSFSDKAAISAQAVSFFPVGFTLVNYATLFQERQFLVSFGVSIERVVLGGAIQFVITMLMAFPLSRSHLQFRGRNGYMWAIVFTMLFHGGLIPWYLTVRSVGLIDTIWALVLPGAVPVFNIILLMNFFRNLPKELDEAARMDGAGPWYMLLKIYIPLSLPAIATVTLFSLVGHWNAFFDGLVLINNPRLLPLQTYINTFLIQPSQFENMDPEALKVLMEMSDLGLNGAKVIVSMVPILLIYPYLQRFFIHGIVLGSVKE